MSEDLAATDQAPSLEDITNVITELEQYRDRLIADTMSTTQKAKLPKSAATALLEPELAQIDSALEKLRQQQAALQSSL